jgi:hypothetical protein
MCSSFKPPSLCFSGMCIVASKSKNKNKNKNKDGRLLDRNAAHVLPSILFLTICWP